MSYDNHISVYEAVGPTDDNGRCVNCNEPGAYETAFCSDYCTDEALDDLYYYAYDVYYIAPGYVDLSLEVEIDEPVDCLDGMCYSCGSDNTKCGCPDIVEIIANTPSSDPATQALRDHYRATYLNNI